MAKPRRTIRVERVIELANGALASGVDSATGIREGISSLLIAILMDVDAYKGFRYLGDYRIDETRRAYFVHPELKEKGKETTNE